MVCQNRFSTAQTSCCLGDSECFQHCKTSEVYLDLQQIKSVLIQVVCKLALEHPAVYEEAVRWIIVYLASSHLPNF